jgi:hypothetical protein
MIDEPSAVVSGNARKNRSDERNRLPSSKCHSGKQASATSGHIASEALLFR